MLLHRLEKESLIHPPRWLADNTMYLVYMGSTAYGANLESKKSDLDCYGFAMPPKEQIFPHLAGYIPGFGSKPQSFNVWSEHHIDDKSSGREYDFAVYSIVSFFDLVKDNNPNMVDSLFVPDRCVMHSTKVSDIVRERRKEFLHKGSYHRFRGYAYQQLKKTEDKSMRPQVKNTIAFRNTHNIPSSVSMNTIVEEMKRRGITHASSERPDSSNSVDESPTGLEHLSDDDLTELFIMTAQLEPREQAVVQFGFDTKNMYHIVRLALEAEEILTTGDLHLDRNGPLLRAIRQGEWSLDRLKEWFQDKEKQLEQAYTDSKLPHSADEDRLKELLLQCLEHHYGSLDKVIKKDTSVEKLKAELQAILDRH